MVSSAASRPATLASCASLNDGIAEVSVGRAELEARREVENIGLALQRVRFQRLRVVVELPLLDRLAAHPLDGRATLDEPARNVRRAGTISADADSSMAGSS